MVLGVGQGIDLAGLDGRDGAGDSPGGGLDGGDEGGGGASMIGMMMRTIGGSIPGCH